MIHYDYDLDKVNAVRAKRRLRPITREEADRTLRRVTPGHAADPRFDPLWFLVMAQALAQPITPGVKPDLSIEPDSTFAPEAPDATA
jgi:hypothetical protein